ncbi:glioma pathogenesis-related protein 1-like isoform X2 [Falco biarmicus]|uniref:glioma pathogenesis-related protein 1-like isoform X2 n=1 Tax=Falco cherrug TaxID=345164 RepID=UPI002479343C|nr:glioma pathogenesis-related protein 1-like isoform X2 [Falco cherrug]XP_055663898.1 glioma pathogenesis-related protein 1-like isoform X2 [Falco peregrinus]XP_056196285.1 glioma pathogenesis-related protein 1-like isoform X2 [Falco biarmicus]
MTSTFSACVLALLHFCCFSDSYEPPVLPDVGDPNFIEECVQTHNRFRSGVNPPASNMLYMSWDPDLAKTAKAWAKKCLFKHNTYLKDPGQAHPRFTPVGENLWTGSLSIFTVQGAITSWYNEVSAYTYATNNCRGACGHYTQEENRTAIKQSHLAKQWPKTRQQQWLWAAVHSVTRSQLWQAASTCQGLGKYWHVKRCLQLCKHHVPIFPNHNSQRKRTK